MSSKPIHILVRIVAFGLLLAAAWNCTKSVTGSLTPNAPPKTFFSLMPDGTLAEGISKTQVHWWAEDQDGYVRGYLFAFAPGVRTIPSPDTLAYAWTTSTDTTIRFPLLTAKDTFLVVVRAVDNTFMRYLDSGAVRLSPFPYLDRNRNGLFDGSDERLPQLTGALDQTGARLGFPTKNSPPIVSFETDASAGGATINPPDTTFTVATFVYNATDPDGDETIAGYRVALNGTADGQWLSIPSTVTMITLVVPRTRSDNATGTVSADVYSGTVPTMKLIGQVPGLKLDDLNTIYLQARDVAGEYSTSVRLPEGTKKWYVKKPRGQMLMINDYTKTDAEAVRQYYRTQFGTVLSGSLANYDELNIRFGSSTGVGAGTLVPRYLNPAFTQTLMLYKYVYWYCDAFPTMNVAQFPLYLYTASGGKVVFTTQFQDAVSDPRGSLVDFAPLDSIFAGNLLSFTTPSPGAARVPAKYLVNPVAGNGYPQLEFSNTSISGGALTFHLIFMRPLYKRADAYDLYTLQADPRTPKQYTGTPSLAVVDYNNRFVFFGVPIHLLDGSTAGGKGVSALLQKIFSDFASH